MVNYILLWLLGALILILTSLKSLNAALKKYVNKIQDALKDKYVNSNELSDIIDIGFTLIEMSKLANNIFGKLLALEYLSVMEMSVVGAFIGLNIFKGFSNFEPALIFLPMGCYFVVITHAIKHHSYARTGQDLCNAYSEIKDGLDNLLMYDGVCDKQRRELESLFNRFSVTSPIRPMDMFDMNYASFAVQNNMMFTYSIILMQFKGY